MPITLKDGSVLHADSHCGRYYAKAQNIVPLLRKAYDRVLNTLDILIMPTTPMVSTPIPTEDQTVQEYFITALGMSQNTCPFNITHHPAISVPCGWSNGLPVGMMLIGRHFEEEVLLRAADAFQKLGTFK